MKPRTKLRALNCFIFGITLLLPLASLAVPQKRQGPVDPRPLPGQHPRRNLPGAEASSRALVVEREALTCLVQFKRHGAFCGARLQACGRWRVPDGALGNPSSRAARVAIRF